MKMKKIIPLLLVSSLIFTSCGKKAEPTVEEETYTAVRVTTASPSGISKEVTYSGKIEPSDQVAVISKMSGTVTNAYKNVGDYVNQGEALLTVDDKDIQNAISQAQAQKNSADLAIKQAQNSKNNITGAQYDQSLLQLETSIKNLENQIATATESKNFAKTALDNAKTAYDNSKTLYDAGVVSKSDFDNAKLGYDQAQVSYSQAEKSLSTLNTQLAQAKKSYELTKNNVVKESQGTAQIGVEQAQAASNSAQLAIDIASQNLKDTTTTSPISGIVSTKGAVVGQMISPTSIAYTISNIDEVVATIKVSENIINTLNVGDPVKVSINSLGNNLSGVVTEINPVGDQTSTFPVKIKLQNSDHSIKPGMFCEVSFVTESQGNAISLPREAVLRNMDKFYVYVEENGVAKMKEVTTGIDTGKDIEIVSGLNAGEKVITEGQTYVSDNEKVKVLTQ